MQAWQSLDCSCWGQLGGRQAGPYPTKGHRESLCQKVLFCCRSSSFSLGVSRASTEPCKQEQPWGDGGVWPSSGSLSRAGAELSRAQQSSCPGLDRYGQLRCRREARFTATALKFSKQTHPSPAKHENKGEERTERDRNQGERW